MSKKFNEKIKMHNKKILWRHHLSEYFPNGRTPEGQVNWIKKDGHLCDDLEKLIAFCRNDGRQWSIAKVECSFKDVRSAPSFPFGWYQAVRPLSSEDGFMPLEEAERRYLYVPSNQVYQ